MPLLYSWSECVVASPVPNGHIPNPYYCCQDCGIEVLACWRCQKRRGNPYDHGLCRVCSNTFACPQPHDPLDPSVAPLFLCSTCTQIPKEFRNKNSTYVDSFKYIPACKCCPLSPKNVVRIPVVFQTSLDHRDPATIPYYARRAYQEEMKFSKNKVIANLLYDSFFGKTPYRTRRLLRLLSQ